MEAQFAAKCSSMSALQVHTNEEMMPFSPGCFWSPYSRPTFLSIFPWSSDMCVCELCKCASALCMSSSDASFVIYYVLLGIPKDMNVLVITRLYKHLWRRSLQQNVPLWLHFKCILRRRWCHLRQGAFEARIVGLLFWAFSLGPPLAKSQKMADLGLLGKFVITRLYGHLWRRSLEQNVPLWLHSKCILIRRWCDFR